MSGFVFGVDVLSSEIYNKLVIRCFYRKLLMNLLKKEKKMQQTHKKIVKTVQSAGSFTLPTPFFVL